MPVGQSNWKPPFRSTISPVTKDARGLTRNRTACAISSGWQKRRTGIARRRSWRCSSLSCSVTILLITYAGAIPLHVIPSAAVSRATVNVSPTSPALDDEYAVPDVIPPLFQAYEMMLTMRPHCFRRIPGTTDCESVNGPSRLTAWIWRHSSCVVASSLLLERMPATLTSTSTSPSFATISACPVRTASASATFIATPMCGPPESVRASSSQSAAFRSTTATRRPSSAR
mmetsp:Transcript_13992/g.43728  ORF Transcript_13992/g.43728 Transcript_13992/m.43728 type:complete len:229 (-) Transcript_13992:161-847(-)